jgi:hypothetical protein
METNDLIAPKKADERLGVSPSAEELESYLNLRKEEIVRLVMCLLIEDGLRKQVASLPASVGVHASQHFGVRAAS